MMCYSLMTQAYSEKEIPSSPNRSRTYDLPITSSDALPLSYRRLVGAKAIKETHNSFFGIGVDLFKSISRMEGLLRFPSYFTNVSTYDQILCFSWFPSNSHYHSNSDAKHFVLDNVDYLEI